MLIDEICSELGVKQERIARIADTASKRYFVFPIKKRDGTPRWIAHPSRPLKLLQRWIIFRVFRSMPVHDAAMAYRRGRNIRDNADRHRYSRYTVRVDFKDFFPSFKAEGIGKFLNHNIDLFRNLSPYDIEFVTQIVCRDDALTIGAPSSPMITNVMMHTFDLRMSEICDSRGLVYTRYADDLFISSKETGQLSDMPGIVANVAAEYPYASLQINHEKTAFLSRKYHREITGLVVTPEGSLSIGRARKREIRALLNQAKYGVLPVERASYLQGILAFVSDVEPRFLASLIRKYGAGLVRSCLGKADGISS